MSSPRRDDPLLVVHVMKTGGQSLLARLLDNHPLERVWPQALAEPETRVGGMAFDVEALAAASRSGRYDAFIGHVPFAAAELFPVRPLVVSVVREPVARTVSHLHQLQTHHEFAGWPIDRIYDEAFVFRQQLHNHQTRVFAQTVDDLGRPDDVARAEAEAYLYTFEPDASPDDLEAFHRAFAQAVHRSPRRVWALHGHAVFRHIEIDDAAVVRARANLERVDLLGLTEQFDRFVRRLGADLGWRVDRAGRSGVGPVEDVSDSLRRRIAEDNMADLELYDHARHLVDGASARRA